MPVTRKNCAFGNCWATVRREMIDNLNVTIIIIWFEFTPNKSHIFKKKKTCECCNRISTIHPKLLTSYFFTSQMTMIMSLTFSADDSRKKGQRLSCYSSLWRDSYLHFEENLLVKTGTARKYSKTFHEQKGADLQDPPSLPCTRPAAPSLSWWTQTGSPWGISFPRKWCFCHTSASGVRHAPGPPEDP